MFAFIVCANEVQIMRRKCADWFYEPFLCIDGLISGFVHILSNVYEIEIRLNDDECIISKQKLSLNSC